MKRTTTVIIGAGQAGLAMSRCLIDRSIDHVIVERGDVANSWRTERWDSLRLLTPNWQSRLPGGHYQGSEPHGYMAMSDVVERFECYAKPSAVNLWTQTNVSSVRSVGGFYEVETPHEMFRCQSLVIASGACNIATIPAFAAEAPSSVMSVTPMTYKRASELRDGGVLIVGGSATGVQLAQEIRATGRPVILSMGEHVRAPRTYRGRDIKWWMDATGLMDLRFDQVDDVRRARRTPSLQLIGSQSPQILDANSLITSGVEIVGRLSAIRDGVAMFSGSLNNACASADLKMNRLLDGIDVWAGENGLNDQIPAPHRFDPTQVASSPRLSLDLKSGEIQTIIWATGYRPDYSWLHLPVLDRKGRLRHTGGVVDMPGVYAMGLPFMRRRKSTLIDGVGADANDLADHMMQQFSRLAA